MHVSANRSRTGNLDAIQFDAFKSVMSRFSTGVVVVTAIDEGLPVGLTCQSLCSLARSAADTVLPGEVLG